MATTTHDSITDRRLEPRRLLPRRPAPHPLANNPQKTADFLDLFYAPNLPIFQRGDMLTFRKADGTTSIILLLAIDGEDVEAIFYDGQPHRFICHIEDVASLRVIRIEEAGDATIAMYSDWCGLH
ncbi:hypothetical protein [Shinella sp.]|uniref:hypothetical protein n=1 Tax=Shinella sp. TaxID=1870904 RepID=UPI0029B98BCA|nr:hypothetical protein [Shinella sp.]MDX3976132.1 hypothetical protein [Shinella sp.]